MKAQRTALGVGGSLRQHATVHALPVLVVGLASVVGALASLVFQAIVARRLGPSDFGLFAAFMAIVNVAAIGSAALQNSVAVETATVLAEGQGPAVPKPRRRLRGNGTVIGLLCAGIVLALSPALTRALGTTPVIVVIAAATVPLSFWLSEGVGVLQGAGRTATSVWWSTAAQLARVALVVVFLALGAGVAGVLVAVLAATAVAMVGVLVVARRTARVRPDAFTGSGLIVLVMSLSFAWLINSDVILLRGGVHGDVVGRYASAAVLVKAAFILPATFSLYLLPRFVRRRGDMHLMRVGERATVALTVVAALAMVTVFWVAGDFVARLVYGVDFESSAPYLPRLALVYLPWVIAQGVLIRLTATASRPAAILVVGAVVAQAIGIELAIPDVAAVMWVQAGVGVLLLGGFAVVARRPAPGSLDAVHPPA